MEDIDNTVDHENEDHEYDMFLSEVVQDDHELLYLDTFLKETLGT